MKKRRKDGEERNPQLQLLWFTNLLCSRASDYGLMKIDDEGRVLYFNEKPKGAELKTMQVDTTVLGLSAEEAKKMPYIASMGIYVFKKDVLLKLLRWRYPTANDFGSEIIPAAAKEFNVQVLSVECGAEWCPHHLRLLHNFYGLRVRSLLELLQDLLHQKMGNNEEMGLVRDGDSVEYLTLLKQSLQCCGKELWISWNYISTLKLYHCQFTYLVGFENML